MSENGRVRLDSWKQIASHFGRDVRTVARWEKDRGLPVHHVPGGRGRRVFAYVDELDRWVEQAANLPTEDANGSTWRRPKWLAAIGVGLVMAVLGVTAWVVSASPLALTAMTLRGRDLVARTETGTDAWSFTVPFTPGLPPAAQAWYDIGEIDGQMGVDAVSTVLGSWEKPDLLYGFTNRGDLLWTHSVSSELTFGTQRFGPPWRGLAVDIFQVDGAPRVAWTTHHHTWWPSILTVHDRDGREIDRFVHPGWLASVRATADGRYLLAAGSANAYRSYALAVLDPRNPGGAPPPPDDVQFQCRDCPSGRPLRYFVLARSELADRAGLPLFHPRVPMRLQLLPAGAVELRVREGDGSAETVYEFNPDLTLVRARVNDAYWQWHRELEQANNIDHSADACRDRDGLSVREWTSATGWVDR